MEVTKEDLRLLDFNRLMDAFPQDVALVREHGRWVIYRDRAGSSVPLHEQHDRQTYEDFIHEFMVQEMKKPYHGDFGFHPKSP